ncbi:MAG: hypothetical protein O3C05_00110 [Proteobacteria bacterium]|nr:hypothetical protein [Pseudomonadota bacterium]
MSFLSHLWCKITPVYKCIIEHPLNAGITSGELEKYKFLLYLEQNEIFASEFLQAISIIISKANEVTEVAHLLNTARNLLQNEVVKKYDIQSDALHSSFHKEGIQECIDYTNFLVASIVMEDIPVALLTIMPHFMVDYHIASSFPTRPDNPYAKWIEMHASESFRAFIEKSKNLVDCLAKEQSPLLLQRMEEVFLHGMLLKWHFCEGIYKFQQRSAA